MNASHIHNLSEIRLKPCKNVITCGRCLKFHEEEEEEEEEEELLHVLYSVINCIKCLL
jgi:hypothetical protein